MILLIDNFDSFVYNLARYLRRLGQQAQVVRNRAIDVEAVRRLEPAAVVLSPGPCTPREAGCSLDVVHRLGHALPILGVCLGHQVIAAAFGGRIVPARQPLHGTASPVNHGGTGIFAGLPSPFSGCRYHSLAVDEASLPACLTVTARSDDGTVMALAHRRYPIVGLQFHPESVLTEHGYPLLAAFLRLAGQDVPARLPALESELAPGYAAQGSAFAPPRTLGTR